MIPNRQQIFNFGLGETADQAKIERWHKSEGDAVTKGEVLLEITTDKAAFEVESPRSGTVRKLLADVKSLLPVGYVIALVG